ncbi:EutN/CcmL family microcompartment protein [Candidatus Sumerlaeota bacterium]|nr:EutN/CcmL family microcompartment protein [Candidatus Sumerlaeota bacterium]
MFLGKVVGQVVATHKDDGLEGFKLLLVQQMGLDQQPRSGFIVACDAVGAGEGELVIVVQGSSARIAQTTKDKPVDAAVIAIVDHLDLEGKRVWSKYESASA